MTKKPHDLSYLKLERQRTSGPPPKMPEPSAFVVLAVLAFIGAAICLMVGAGQALASSPAVSKWEEAKWALTIGVLFALAGGALVMGEQVRTNHLHLFNAFAIWGIVGTGGAICWGMFTASKTSPRLRFQTALPWLIIAAMLAALSITFLVLAHQKTRSPQPPGKDSL